MQTPRICSVARALEVVGERWSILVVREVSFGVRRFDAIQAATGAPRAVLTARLAGLVASGVLSRRSYREDGSRTRWEYRLTQAGRDLLPVLTALRQWGDRYLADADGPPARFRHVGCGAEIHARHVCEAGHLVEDSREITRSVRGVPPADTASSADSADSADGAACADIADGADGADCADGTAGAAGTAAEPAAPDRLPAPQC
jgi:DNA-binding HxlR family transcriptional regulator